MTDLLVCLKATLQNPNYHVRRQPKSLLNREEFRPSRRPILLVEKTLGQHLMKNAIVDLGPIIMKNLGRADAPSPDLIFRGTIGQDVLIPTTKSVGTSTHLDLPLHHPIDDLKHV